MKRSPATVVISLLLALPALAADESESRWPSLNGYVKSTMLGEQFPGPAVAPPLEGNKPYGLWQNTLRLRLFDKPVPQLSWEAAEELSLVACRPEALAGQGFIGTPDTTYRIHDFRQRLNTDDSDNVQALQNLDRLNLSLALGWGDLTIGRQAIAFGSARVINPTDVLAPILFQDINRENRSGVDAVRLRVTTGEMSEIDLGLVLGNGGDLENNAVFLRPKIRVLGTDATFTVMEFRRNLMLGIDLARDIGGATWWIEGAHTFAKAFDEPVPEEDYFRLSLGVQYRLAGDLLATLEYHYSSAGTRDPNACLANTIGASGISPATAFADGGVYLLGQHYLAPGLAYEFTPLLNGSLSALINLTDGSTYLNGRLGYSLSDDQLLEMGFFCPVGQPGDRQGGMLIPESEFSLYPSTIYLGFRCYF
jgi:hypothetical protein